MSKTQANTATRYEVQTLEPTGKWRKYSVRAKDPQTAAELEKLVKMALQLPTRIVKI